LINVILTIRFIKKDMACKKCKKNARAIVNSLMKKVKGEPIKTKEETPCQKKRSKEQNWLVSSEKGKKLMSLAKPRLNETTILVIFAWVPLFVGYWSILRFIINLF